MAVHCSFTWSTKNGASAFTITLQATQTDPHNDQTRFFLETLNVVQVIQDKRFKRVKLAYRAVDDRWKAASSEFGTMSESHAKPHAR